MSSIDNNISILKSILDYLNNNKKKYFGYDEDFIFFVKKKIIENKEWEELLNYEKDPESIQIIKDTMSNNKKKIIDYILNNNVNAFDHYPLIFNISSGIGGEEASLFTLDLFEAYELFFKKHNLKYEILDYKSSISGGYKFIKIKVSGKNVFKWLKFETGIQRVQRVPKTESSGRIHTSTASITLCPILSSSKNKININEKEIRIDFFRASGKGGQHVNKTETAVRITHLPTNIMVTCQEERSQFQNLAKAKKKLQHKLMQKKSEEFFNKKLQLLNAQFTNYQRSTKIRTFNYSRNTVTDHRISSHISLEDFFHTQIIKLVHSLISQIEVALIIKIVENLII